MLNKLKLGLIALLLPLLAFGQSYPSPTFNNVTSQGTATLNNATVSGTFIASGKVGLTSLAAQAANTVVANVTASSASPTAVALPSCSTANSALQYTSATGFSCGTSFALTGGTLAQFAATTSAQLAGIVSDETGSGSLVFATSPTLVTPILGAATATTPTAGDASTRVATTAFLASPGPIGNTTANTGKFTTLQATSTITPSSTAGIVGTTTNDNANAGSFGESGSVQTGPTAIVSLTNFNAASTTLSAGDWEVWGDIHYALAGTASPSGLISAITTTSLSVGSLGQSYQWQWAIVPGNQDQPAPRQIIKLATPTTVYLVGQATMGAGGSPTATGTLRWRRMR